MEVNTENVRLCLSCGVMILLPFTGASLSPPPVRDGRRGGVTTGKEGGGEVTASREGGGS